MVQCIYELVDGGLVAKDQDGDGMLYIHPDECTSCDACMPVCPVDAILPADKVPLGMRDYIETNRFIFAETSET